MSRSPRQMSPEQVEALATAVLEIAVMLASLRDQLQDVAAHAQDLAVAIDARITALVTDPPK
jgi:hypothetical protein